MNILVDFVIVYLFVPMWITLFAIMLGYSREKYVWTQSFLGDILVLGMPFVVVAIPLNYLRLQASNPLYFLHHCRVETTEMFMEKTRSQPEPSAFDPDILVLAAMILSYNLWDPFQDQPFSQNTFSSLYTQSLAVLVTWDAGTYWIHRILHHPKWYKYHKKHHEVKNTIASRAHYLEAGEVFLNASTIYVVPLIYLLCGTGMVHEVWITGSAFMLGQAYINHCDLYLISARQSLGLIWGDAAVLHSDHHSKNDGNFGNVSPLIWDWICDTRRNYSSL